MQYNTIDIYISAIRHFSQQKLYIVGAGKYGEILGRYFNKHNIPWEGYIDKKLSLKSINGKTVYTYKYITDGYYVISSYLYRFELLGELERYGIVSERVIMYSNQEIFYDIYNDLINFKKYTNKVKKFQKKHCHERCFIIGNGPSLKIEDLEKIQKEISFASNAIYALYSHTNWRPTYYCAGDPIFCKEMMSDKMNLKKIIDGCQAAFTSIISEGILFRDDKDVEQLYYLRRVNETSDSNSPKFSIDCSEQTYLAGTITYDMLQLAVYMGIQEIYLIGMDCNYSIERHLNGTITRNNLANYMPEIESEAQNFYNAVFERHGQHCIADIDLQLAGYQSAKQYGDSHNIKIYNATRGGKLEIFPRINFDSLF